MSVLEGIHPAIVQDNQGTLLIGLILGCILYGITTCQTVIFFRHAGKDPLILKCIAMTIWICETLHTGMHSQALYFYVVQSRGNTTELEKATWTIKTNVFPAACVVLISQYLWTTRVWALNRSPRRTLVAAVMFSFVLFDVAVALAWTFKSLHATTFTELQQGNMALILMSLGFVAMNDVVTTAMLCYLLHRLTGGHGFRSADSIVTKLLAYALNTGALTCIGCLVMIGTLATKSSETLYIAVYEVLVKIYANSVLGMLNWRRSLGQEEVDESTYQLSTVPWGLSMSSEVYSLSENP